MKKEERSCENLSVERKLGFEFVKSRERRRKKTDLESGKWPIGLKRVKEISLTKKKKNRRLFNINFFYFISFKKNSSYITKMLFLKSNNSLK